MKAKFIAAGLVFTSFVLVFLVGVIVHIDSNRFEHYTGKCQLITEKSPSTNTLYGGRCEYETKEGNVEWENIYVIGICRLNRQCVLDAIDKVRHKEELNKVEITYEDI